MRAAFLTINTTLVDLGRVEILFHLGAPIAVLDWKRKELHAVRAKKGTDIAEWIERLQDDGKVALIAANQADLEKAIVLAFTDHYPNGRSPGPHSPTGQKVVKNADK